MKWRHWAILIVLVLLNYIIFSTAFTKLAEQSRPLPRPTRTLQPTFESVEASPMAWIVKPTSTRHPTRTPVPPTSTPLPTAAVQEITSSPELTATEAPAITTVAPTATETPVPPTNTPTPEAIIHNVKSGETLSIIASQYGVTVDAIAQANNITDTSVIVVGQQLIIPAPGQVPPTVAPAPQATKPPAPQPTKKPTALPPSPTVAAAQFQYTAEILWDPMVAPNCAGPAVGKQSIIRDTGGNPVNGVRVEVDCYGNKFASHASGTPGEYDPGHYDFAFGQSTPQNWTCTARVLDHNGQPAQSSEVATIVFDTNDCNPHGNGHQVAIVNWTKHW